MSNFFFAQPLFNMEVLEGIIMEVKNSIRLSGPRNQSSQQSFGSARYVYWRDLANDLYKASEGKSKMLQSLGINNGENLNNIVTAVGTAAVAPIFIRYNPIAKQDKETKAYSAWRQPISAVIALALQLPIMSAYNNLVDRHASNLRTDRMDLSAKPRMAALNSKIDADWREEKMAALKENRDPMKKSDFYDLRLKKYQDDAFYSELSDLRKNHKDMVINDFDLVKPEEFKNAKDKVLKEVLEKEFNVSADELNDKKLYKKFGDFKKEGKALRKKYKIDYKELSAKVEEYAKEYSIKAALIDIQKEARVKLESSKIVQAMTDKWIKKTCEINEMPEANFKKAYPGLTKAKVLEQEEIKILKETVKELKAKAAKIPAGSAERDGVELVIKKLEKNNKLCHIKNHGHSIEEVTQSVKLKKFLKVKINRAEEVLKNYKKQSGLIVGLAVLPITCGLLNWAYPRIMEKYFPELTAAKKAKVHQLNKKTESQAESGKEAK